MLKERVVQVDIKATSKSYISRNPLDRICHVQTFPCLQRPWDILSEINMNNLQGNRPKYETSRIQNPSKDRVRNLNNF